MMDLMDRFIMYLMNEFYESLEADLKRWTENLVAAVKENNDTNIETSMKYINNCRELMHDLSDENMDIKDFVGLLAEKYGFALVEAEV